MSTVARAQISSKESRSESQRCEAMLTSAKRCKATGTSSFEGGGTMPGARRPPRRVMVAPFIRRILSMRLISSFICAFTALALSPGAGGSMVACGIAAAVVCSC